jgi:hypothetical protein
MPKAGNANPNGTIIFMDEFSRGKEDIRQAMYQFLSQKKIHTYELPENSHIICGDNPPNSGSYEVYEMDDALKNRLAWVKMRPTFEETQTYLTKKHGKNMVIDWLRSEKGASLEYGDDFEIEGRTYSPRIEEAHIILYDMIKTKTSLTKMKILSTCIKPELVQSFLSFEEEMSHIYYEDVLKGKGKEQVKELLKDGKLSVLSTLVIHLADYFRETAGQASNKEQVKHTTDFLNMLSEELVTVFINTVGKEAYMKKTCIVWDEYFKEKMKGKLNEAKSIL